MSEILGRDCDGKPLRAGDRVVLLRASCAPHLLGAAVTVLGPTDSPFPRDAHLVAIDVPYPGKLGGWYGADPKKVRRIDDNENDDTASWEAIKKLTGWQPRKEPVGAA